MAIFSPQKGVSSIKTLHTVTKSAARQNDTADFLELYMLEKEKHRLMSEEVKLHSRLEFIQNRLRTIESIYLHSSDLLHYQNGFTNDRNGERNSSSGFTTIQIEY
ncbi:MAG: hypothetical protein WCH05_03170 [Chlorobiaceae bacterium]